MSSGTQRTPNNFISTSQLAKALGVDPRTAARRLTLAGLDPDAFLHEAGGSTGLWAFEDGRVRQLAAVVATPDDSLSGQIHTMLHTTQ